uniref:Uncharacterized protein n=1 Tax=Arundo donax TaxID=35708 RepID=A0A0A9GWL6_ARUDO
MKKKQRQFIQATKVRSELLPASGGRNQRKCGGPPLHVSPVGGERRGREVEFAMGGCLAGDGGGVGR